MRRKFVDGTRVRGREEGAASFRGRTGTVVSYWGQAQYLVRFDDGREEYAYSYWLEAV
jgi:hypothetical protein